jgi:hypothetical protein
MPISSLFEIGARILRRHARLLLSVAILVQLPGAILDAFAQQRLAESVSPLLVGLDTDSPQVLTPTDSQTAVILGALALVAAAMLLSMLLGAIATVAYATVVSRDYHAAGSTLRELLRLALRRAFAAVAAAVMASLAVIGVTAVTIVLALGCVVLLPTATGEAGGLGVFLALVVGVGGGVLALTLVVRLCLATIAVAVEGVGPLSAVRRSWHLTGSNTWRTLVVLLLLAFIISVSAGLLAQLLGAVFTDTIGVRLGVATTMDELIAAAVSVLFAPVTVVIQTVLYFDLRVRRDGWDLPAAPVGGDAETLDDTATVAG